MDNQFQPPPPLPPVITTQPAINSRRPDPGSSAAATIALVAATILIFIAFVFQQLSVQRLASVKPDPTKVSDTSIFSIYAKGFTKVSKIFAQEISPAEKATALAPFTVQISDMAQTPDEKLRAAIAGGEIADAKKAVDMLDAAKAWLKTQEDLNTANTKKGFKLDSASRDEFEKYRGMLLRHYQSKLEDEGAKSAPAPLTDAEITDIKTHFGWFGRVAAVYGEKDAPERATLFRYAEWILVFLIAVTCIIVFAVLLGFVLCIVALVGIAQGKARWKFVPPAPGGSVYLETVAVFVASFIGLQLLVRFLAFLLLPKGTTEPPSWFNALHLGLQWLLVLVPLYPLLRGVSFARWRDDMGFVAPKGVFREIGCGIFAYFAGIPVFLFGAFVSVFLKFLLDIMKSGFGEDAGPPATNPIFDEILGSDPFALVLLVSLATIWAPFVEEAIFRGAFFRHIRSRAPLIIAAMLSALVFGMLHGYEFVLLGPVISLGFVFAFMREWRKSLIPSITAHMLHNGSVMLLVIMMIRMIAAE